MLSDYCLCGAVFYYHPCVCSWLTWAVCPCLLCCVARCLPLWQGCGTDLEVGVVEYWQMRCAGREVFFTRFWLLVHLNLSFMGNRWNLRLLEKYNPKDQIFLWILVEKRAGQHCLKATSKPPFSLLILSHFKLHLEILTQTWNFSQHCKYSFISLLWLLNMCPAKEICWRGRRKFLSSLMLSSLRSSDSVVLWKHRV